MRLVCTTHDFFTDKIFKSTCCRVCSVVPVQYLYSCESLQSFESLCESLCVVRFLTRRLLFTLLFLGCWMLSLYVKALDSMLSFKASSVAYSRWQSLRMSFLMLTSPFCRSREITRVQWTTRAAQVQRKRNGQQRIKRDMTPTGWAGSHLN